MSPIDNGRSKSKVVYTAKTHTVGGRDNGFARSSDGRLDIALSTPGSARIGTNPEQLFAAALSACFESAIADAARQSRLIWPPDTTIAAEVDLIRSEDGYHLSARLNVNFLNIDDDTARLLIEDAQEFCPYSKAVGNDAGVTIYICSALKGERNP